jgi:hypothetical protein
MKTYFRCMCFVVASSSIYTLGHVKMHRSTVLKMHQSIFIYILFLKGNKEPDTCKVAAPKQVRHSHTKC